MKCFTTTTKNKIRLKDETFRYALEELMRRIDDWIEGQKFVRNGFPTEDKLEIVAKNVLQRILSVAKGRYVVLSSGSWKYWKKVIMPLIRNSVRFNHF